MNKEFYQNSKLYKIIDNTNDNIFIGSTCKLLCQRIAQLKDNYKQYLKCNKVKGYNPVFEIIQNNNCEIILIEAYPCANKDELNRQERLIIDSMNCINKNLKLKKEFTIPGILELEEIEKNNNKIKEYQKNYYKNKTKQNNINNNNEIKEYRKKYYLKNKLIKVDEFDIIDENEIEYSNDKN